MKDYLQLVGIVVAALLGSLLLNAFVFRSFSVIGPSMEPTFHTDERVIVNKLPSTLAHVRGQEYVPERSHIIVFKNPLYVPGTPDEFVIKRVIAFAGERVVVRDGTLRVFNTDHPDGFDPDAHINGPRHPTSGSIDVTIGKGMVFVSGDNRVGSFSLDSRNGLGQVPLENIQGQVTIRYWPLSQFRFF